jgi:hypothetical protein
LALGTTELGERDGCVVLTDPDGGECSLGHDETTARRQLVHAVDRSRQRTSTGWSEAKTT